MPGVVLSAGIDLGYAIDHFAQECPARNPVLRPGSLPSIRCRSPFRGNEVFIDGVVDSPFDQDIDPVIRCGAIPNLPMYMPGRMRMCSFQSKDRIFFFVIGYL